MATWIDISTSGFIKLFDATDTEFYSNGILTVKPLKLKEVKQKGLNGWHIEVETDLQHKDLIAQDMLAVVKTKSKLRPQAFRINNITSTQNKLTFTANHVMFDAHDYYLVDVRPTEMGAVGALNYVNDRTDIPSPFTFTSDVNNSQTAYFIDRSLFYAMQVIEERWGGVYDADNWDISLRNTVGVDRGETIAYGKNLQDIKVVEDWSKVVTKLYAVGFDGLRLPEVYLQADVTYDVPYTKRVDFETKFEEDEDRTEENLLPELRANAEAYLLENKYPKVAYEVKSDINQLMEIGDTIHVKHPLVMLETEVQEYEYNVLTQRVVKIVFGNYNRSVKKRFDKIKTDIEDVKKQTSKFEVIVGDQTDLINNLNKFGHVYIDDNQILILDALPKQDAENVWRWNLGGLGFSSTGIQGPFTQAWTMDGVFNTDFIAANSITVNQLSSDVGSSLDISSNNAINQIVTQIDETTGLLQGEISSQVQQTVKSFDVIFNKIEADQNLTNGEIELIQSYFRINENGVIIGKSDSAIEFFAENNRVGFRENGNDIAYWEEGTMHVDRLIAVTTIMVGYHLIEKYDSPVAGNTTIVRLGD